MRTYCIAKGSLKINKIKVRDIENTFVVVMGELRVVEGWIVLFSH